MSRDRERRSYRPNHAGHPTILYIRNISDRVRYDDLRHLFQKYGRVVDVTIPLDYYSGLPKGYCFIEYEDPRDAEEAHYKMARQRLFGREIEVEFARGDRKTAGEMRNREHDRREPRHNDRNGGRRDRSRDRRERSRSRSAGHKRRSRSRGRDENVRSKSRNEPSYSRSKSRSYSKNRTPSPQSARSGASRDKNRSSRGKSFTPARNSPVREASEKREMASRSPSPA